jgi:hypothetical protein
MQPLPGGYAPEGPATQIGNNGFRDKEVKRNKQNSFWNGFVPSRNKRREDVHAKGSEKPEKGRYLKAFDL